MPASHLASVTGEPSSDLRHSAYETSEPNERKGGAMRRLIKKQCVLLWYINERVIDKVIEISIGPNGSVRSELELTIQHISVTLRFSFLFSNESNIKHPDKISET